MARSKKKRSGAQGPSGSAGSSGARGRGSAADRPSPGGASTKAIVLTVVVVMIVLGVVFSLLGANENTPARDAGAPVGAAELGAPVPASMLIRPDSHRLAPPAGDRVRVVEFIDLECEACRAAYPTVERLRSEYAGRVDFVARYFPLPGHLNAEPAAFATEAAARQGRFEAMYQTMYQTQADWGDQNVDHTATFRGFAERIGLDMARYDRDVADPAVAQRVLADRDDGIAVGVQGTPTFFVNDRPVNGSSGYPALKEALDQALAAP